MRLVAKLRAWAELGRDFWILALSALIANSLHAGFGQFLILYLTTKELGASYELATLVLSASLVVFLLLLPLGARAVDVWGRKPFLVLTPTISGLSALILAAAPDWRVALLALMLGNVPLSFSGPAMYSYVGEATLSSKLGTAYGTFNSLITAGVVAGLLAVGVMITALGYRTTLVIVALSLFAAAAMRLLLKEVGAKGGRFLSKELLASFVRPLRIKEVAAVLVLAALYYAVNYHINFVALPVLLGKAYGIDEAVIGFIVAASNIAYALAAPLGGRAVDLYDLRLLAALQLACKGASAALLTFTSSPLLLALIWTLNSATSVFVVPSIESLLAARSGENKAQAFAAYGFARNFLTMLTLYPVGVLLDALWFPATMYVLAALVFLLIPVAAATLPKRVRS